ncbi:MAG: hypothetical protein ACLU38_10625 [Dysosmobacter sp.]
MTWLLLAISMLGSLLTVPAGAAAHQTFRCQRQLHRHRRGNLRLMGVLDGCWRRHLPSDTVLNRARSSARWRFHSWTAAASWGGIPPSPSSRT